MSDEPQSDPLPETAVVRDPVVETAAAPVTAVRERRPILPILCLIGFVILAVGIGYVYQRQQQMQVSEAPAADQSGAVAALRADLNALKARVAALDGQEKQDAAQWQAASALQSPAVAAPAPPAPAPASTVAAQPVDSGLAQQVAALSDRLDTIASSQSKQAQQAQAAPSAQDIAALSSHLDGLAQRESQDMGDVRKQVAAVTGQIQGLAKDTSGLPKLAAQSSRLGQIVHAQEALRAGVPLGPLDGAPPALVKFETTPPPTEAALRLSFPAAAKMADAAGQPLPSQGKFWHRVWLRVQNLIVVRRGDQVLVGDPTGGVLAHAQRLLDAGDLSGSLTVLDTLADPARGAMAPWVTQAKTLMGARQALAQMAAG